MASILKKRSAQRIITLVLGVIAAVICITALAIFRSGPKSSKAFPTYTPQEEAWYSCIRFSSRHVGLYPNPPPYIPGSVTEIAEDQYRVDVFYATQGQVYRCEVFRHSNGNMELLKLEKTNSYP